MSVINGLTAGPHTIVFKEMPGYENLTCAVTVSNGAVQCTSVNGNPQRCGTTTPPGVTIESKTALRAHLKPGATVTDIDTWVASKGGKENITGGDLRDMRSAYHGFKDAGFLVVGGDVRAVRAYYHGFF